MAKEIGQINVSRTEDGLRIDISGGELARAFCCCCGPCCCEDKKSDGSSKDKSESNCCSS